MSDFYPIDKYNLDSELDKQKDLTYEHGVKLADAKVQVDKAKAKLKLTEARIYKELKNSGEKYTEQGLKHEMVLDPRWMEAIKAMARAEHEVGVCVAARDALVDRKHGMQSMVTLLSLDYWSSKKGGND